MKVRQCLALQSVSFLLLALGTIRSYFTRDVPAPHVWVSCLGLGARLIHTNTELHVLVTISITDARDRDCAQQSPRRFRLALRMYLGGSALSRFGSSSSGHIVWSYPQS